MNIIWGYLKDAVGGKQNDMETKYVLKTFTLVYSVHGTDTVDMFVLN